MDRRTLLKSGIAASSAAFAGCLDVFETESVWQSVPVVEDRPDAVYMPAGIEEMATYGMAHSGDYAIALHYTFPHRFYNVTPSGMDRVDVQESDAMHLMVTVWDRETETVLPAEVQLDLYSAGTLQTSLRPWAMISQRMGFHYGDNIQLDTEGEYTAEVQVASVEAQQVGTLRGLPADGTTVEVDFEYNVDDIYDLSFEEFDEDERGRRAAVPLMQHHEHGNHDDHAGHDMHVPVSTVPEPESLPGSTLGTDTDSDAVIAASLVEAASRFHEEQYLLVSPRTPYNRIPLPEMSIEATGYRGEETVFANEPLSATLDHDVDYHYGLATDHLETVERVRLDITSDPRVSRHDGYETAFLNMDSVEFPVDE